MWRPGCFPGAWRRRSWHFQVANWHLQSIIDLCPLHDFFCFPFLGERLAVGLAVDSAVDVTADISADIAVAIAVGIYVDIAADIAVVITVDIAADIAVELSYLKAW